MRRKLTKAWTQNGQFVTRCRVARDDRLAFRTACRRAAHGRVPGAAGRVPGRHDLVTHVRRKATSMTSTSQRQTARPRHRMPSFPAFEASGRYDEATLSPQRPDARPSDSFGRAAWATPAARREPATPEERTDAVVSCVCAQNPLREVLYKLLVHCIERRGLREAEEFVTTQDEYVYSHIEQTPHTLVCMLLDAGGLERIALDARGEVLDEARLAALSEDEADDRVDSYALLTTDAGRAAASLLDPARRLRARLAEHPHRAETYRKVLELCARSPQKLPQIEQFFKDTPGLALDQVTSYHTLSPDYYVDRLEKCGAIVWRGAWCATQAGVEALAAWPDRASHSA